MIAGIDIGTSSVKVLVTDGVKTVQKVKKSYASPGLDGLKEAMYEALSSLTSEVDALAFSSQVGTYITDSGLFLSWRDAVGGEELAAIKQEIDQETFIKEISMPHPDILSYPMPRLAYIKKQEKSRRIGQPKDFLIEELTGRFVSDKFSWRGLANLQTGAYSRRMLDYLGIDEEVLPLLLSPTEAAGYLTDHAALRTSLRCGIPVYTGCNDYYAGLLGMGIVHGGMLFDITGTSEHIGVTTKVLDRESSMVTGPYFFDNVHYGVTASSGKSLDFGIRTFGFDSIDIDASLSRRAPIFLPYLGGERAPIWDSDARGLFFGISEDTTPSDFAYSVLEGVAFSAYHIYECLGSPKAEAVITAGGAAKDARFNSLKASLFGLPVITVEEEDTSAYGACMLAAVGSGVYPSILAAAKAMCRTGREQEVLERPLLQSRFALYKALYTQNKENFKKFRRLEV